LNYRIGEIRVALHVQGFEGSTQKEFGENIRRENTGGLQIDQHQIEHAAAGD
jgi:hypothetical protein